MSGLQLMILPTAEVMRTHRPVFTGLQKEAGLPMMYLLQYLINLLALGEPEKLTRREFMGGFINFLHDSPWATVQVVQFVSRPEFGSAFYALYEAVQHTQELMVTAPRDVRSSFLSGLAYHGWNGDDLIVSREITSINNDRAIAKWG